MFRDYYKNSTFSTNPVSRIDEREFGFVSFEGWMLRHKCFKNYDELTSFVRAKIPRDCYSSCAYYEDPEAEMNAKGWNGADLIFDVDADHLCTPCEKTHDNWTCGQCGLTDKGIPPGRCPVCDGEKFNVNTWPCEQCVNSAKAEIVKVLEMLMSNFGFSEKEVHVFFSGHRGYHIHVENEAVRSLDSAARREIVDYVCCLGLELGFQGSRKNSLSMPKVLQSLRLDDFGWRGRVAKSLYTFLSNAKQEDYQIVGLEKKAVEAIMKNKASILENWKRQGYLVGIKGLGFRNWRKIVEFCTKSQSASVDTVVSTDIHRLIRLAGTLHGKTGLRKVEFPISRIEDFDPFKEAIAFSNGSADVFVHDAPEFRLGEEIFGPYKDKKVELPLAAAILLICKNRAEVVNHVL